MTYSSHKLRTCWVLGYMDKGPFLYRYFSYFFTKRVSFTHVVSKLWIHDSTVQYMLSQQTKKIPRYYHGRCLKGLNMSTIVFYFSMIDGKNRQAPQGCPREPPPFTSGLCLKAQCAHYSDRFLWVSYTHGSIQRFFCAVINGMWNISNWTNSGTRSWCPNTLRTAHKQFTIVTAHQLMDIHSKRKFSVDVFLNTGLILTVQFNLVMMLASLLQPHSTKYDLCPRAATRQSF